MRELELPEIELVAGGFGFDDDTARQPTVQVVGQRTTRSVDRFDHWDTPQYGGISAGDIIALGGGGGAGPAADENSDDQEHSAECEALAAEVASAQGLVDIYEGLLRDQYGPPTVSEIIVEGRDSGPDSVMIASLQAWHAAFSAELAEAQDALADAGC